MTSARPSPVTRIRPARPEAASPDRPQRAPAAAWSYARPRGNAGAGGCGPASSLVAGTAVPRARRPAVYGCISRAVNDPVGPVDRRPAVERVDCAGRGGRPPVPRGVVRSGVAGRLRGERSSSGTARAARASRDSGGCVAMRCFSSPRPSASGKCSSVPAKLELIDGNLHAMTPEGSRHALGMDPVADCLRGVFGPGFYVRIQHPLAADDYSEPEPDVAVVTGPMRDTGTPIRRPRCWSSTRRTNHCDTTGRSSNACTRGARVSRVLDPRPPGEPSRGLPRPGWTRLSKRHQPWSRRQGRAARSAPDARIVVDDPLPSLRDGAQPRARRRRCWPDARTHERWPSGFRLAAGGSTGFHCRVWPVRITPSRSLVRLSVRHPKSIRAPPARYSSAGPPARSSSLSRSSRRPTTISEFSGPLPTSPVLPSRSCYVLLTPSPEDSAAPAKTVGVGLEPGQLHGFREKNGSGSDCPERWSS